MVTVQFLVILVVLVLAVETNASSFIDKKEAIEFLERLSERDIEDRDVDTRFLYTSKEQRREAKEKYEEKCERNMISKKMGKARWCPLLEDWPEWQQVVAKDGIKYTNNG